MTLEANTSLWNLEKRNQKPKGWGGRWQVWKQRLLVVTGLVHPGSVPGQDMISLTGIIKSSRNPLMCSSHIPHYIERQVKQAGPGWLKPRSSWLEADSCYSQAISRSVLGQGYHLHLLVDWGSSYRLVKGASEEILNGPILLSFQHHFDYPWSEDLNMNFLRLNGWNFWKISCMDFGRRRQIPAQGTFGTK